MAEAYLFSVLVELEGNPDIPKLKNKLVEYFLSKKSSIGDDCLVEYDISKGQGAVVRFRTAEARQMVLEKQEHKIKLDQGVLKLILRLPSDEVTSAQEILSAVNSGKQSAVVPKDLPESGDGETACPEDSASAATDKTELQSTSAVLGNIQESMNQSFLEMLVENIMNAQTSASPTAFSLEILPDISMAVVTFKNVKDTEYFISNCTSHKIFKQKELSVKLLEITAKVKDESIPPNYSSDHLPLYYEKEGEVVDIEMCEEDQSAIITFQDPHAVHRVTKKHHDEKQPIKAFPCYESLGTALYDKDQPTLKLPAAFTENIDQSIWRYLYDNQEATATINKIMAENFCKVDLQHHTVQLRPLPSLLKQKDVKAKHVQQWKDTVKATFTQALSKFKSLELHVQDCAWEESEKEICKAMSGEAVVVVPDKAKGALIVVGLVDEVDRLSQSLNEIMDKIARIIEREKTSKTEELHLPPSIYHVILQDGLQGKIAGEYPELKMAYNRESQNVILTGLMQQVWGANRKIIDGMSALKRKKVEVSNYVLEFLQEEDQEKLSNSLFTSQSVNAALEIDRNGVELLAVSDLALSEAKSQLEKCLVSKYIDVEDSNVLEMSGWKDLTSRLEKTYNILSRTFMVKTSGVHPNIKVVVAGNTDIVNSVQKELGGFLFQNAPVVEILPIKSNAIVKFIQEKKSAWSNIVKGGVKVSFQDGAICLSGIRVHVSDCLTLFKDLVSSTYFDTLQVPEPGAKKFFQDEEAMYVEAVKIKTACVVQLVDEMHLVNNEQTVQAMEEMVPNEFGNHGGNNLQQHLAISTDTQRAQTKGIFSKITSSSGMHETTMGGVVIQVVTGDITKETTDVIVNSTNKTFNLKTGVSKAILDAAGPTVEAECQQLRKTSDQPMILTEPGNLQSKKILHVVGISDPQNIHECVKDALKICARKDFKSISFPALGTGQGNVQVSQVANAMFDALVEVVGKKSVNTLRLVRIVIFQSAMLTEFYNSMLKKEGRYAQEEEDTDAQEAGTALQYQGSLFKAFDNIGTKIKSIFKRSKGGKPQKHERFVFMDKEVDPACFHICGDSQAKVDEAKQWVKDLILKDQDSSIITDDAIINLTTSDRQRISNMINTMEVRVEQESSKAKLTIEGIPKDVLKVTSEIQKMLQRIRSEEELNRSAELASTMVEWQYQHQGGQYQSFDHIHNFHLEQANETKKQHVEVTIQGQMYKVTLPNGPATDNHGNSLDIRRIDKAAHDSLPQYWDAMPDNSSCQSFPIQPGTSEHDEVLGLFQATCQNTVLKIERIQNPSLWRNIQIKKQEMDSKNRHQNNEKRLFHGTCPQFIDRINANGFNRSFAGKNAAAYGNGTYFAVEASYSADDTYSVPDSQGQKHMYLCHVLIGDFTEGQQDMIVPPAKSKSTTQLYDSVTDDPTAPSMFVVFNDIQAYPAYLITFI